MSKTTAEGPMELSEKIKTLLQEIIASCDHALAPSMGMMKFANDAEAILKEWDASQLEQAQTWIPVSTKPEATEMIGVLIAMSSGSVLQVVWHPKFGFIHEDDYSPVGSIDPDAAALTHWMPLPAPPSLHP